jgi:hypothetical protein
MGVGHPAWPNAQLTSYARNKFKMGLALSATDQEADVALWRKAHEFQEDR